MRMIMSVFGDWLSIRPFNLGSQSGFSLNYKNLLTAVAARAFVHAMRETETTALFVLNCFNSRERVMRPAIIGVTSRMAHAY